MRGFHHLLVRRQRQLLFDQDLALGLTDVEPLEQGFGIRKFEVIGRLFDLVWSRGPQGTVTYGDIYHQNEVEQSTYNFELADTESLFQWFDVCEAQCQALIEKQLPLPAYEQVMKASHTFNLLDARHAISVTERQRFILRVRTLSRGVAESYYATREALGFPLIKTDPGTEMHGG